MTTRHGIDVHFAQGTIDWPTVAAQPFMTFAGIQCGWTYAGGARDRNEMVQDSAYTRNVAGARAARLAVVHYLVPVNRPWREQLDRFLSLTGPIPVGEGVMFDLEYVGAQQLGWSNVQAMMNEAEQRLQRPVLHYGELFMKLDTAARPKWPAHYGANPATEANRAAMEARYPYQGRTVWQYAGGPTASGPGGRCPGVPGPVDLNEILDAVRFNAALGKGTATVENTSTKRWISTWDVKPSGKRPTITPRLVILHTNAAANPASIQAVVNAAQAGGTQPHYQAQGGFHADGDTKIYELLPPDREGVGSWSADPFAITIETQDNGAVPLSKLNQTPWSPKQFEAIAQVVAYLCQRFNIPVRQADAWNGSGIGWHRMWGVNTREAKYKGEPPGPGYPNPWTKTVGKTCPGDARVNQMPMLIARVKQLLGNPIPDVPPVPQPQPVKDDAVLGQVAGDNAVFNIAGGSCSWVRSGDDAAQLALRVGAPVLLSKAYFGHLTLSGPVPVGATIPWTAADFAPAPTGGGGGGGGEQSPIDIDLRSPNGDLTLTGRGVPTG